jgi:hypothetical protein
MDGQDNQQQQQGLQSASQDTGTADSSLDWGPDVSYQWLVGIVGFSYADVCRVRADDPIDVFRLVAFHFEDASRSADSLAESIPDYVRCRRDDGLRPPTLRAVYSRIRTWWMQRYYELPVEVVQVVREILDQHARQYEEVRAGPLTQAELHY